MLEKLVYVPGLWRCVKCDGTVTARGTPGDKCPNCNSPLWRVTERQAGNDMVDRAKEYLARAVTAETERDRLRSGLLAIHDAAAGSTIRAICGVAYDIAFNGMDADTARFQIRRRSE